jgi:hypothetical protein
LSIRSEVRHERAEKGGASRLGIIESIRCDAHGQKSQVLAEAGGIEAATRR